MMITKKPAEDLHKLYLSKRKSYTDQIPKSSNKTIRQNLLRCALMVDLCLQTMIALSKALPGFSNFYQREKDQAHTLDTEMVTHLQESIAAAERISIPELKDNTLAFADLAEAYHRDTRKILNDFAAINIELINASLDQAQESFRTLLESNDSYAVLEAVKKLMLNISGSIPGGILITSLYDISQIVSSRNERTATASEYLNELESFEFVAYHWCTAIQLLIDLICVIDKYEFESTPLTIEGATARVNDRFQTILNTLSVEPEA